MDCGHANSVARHPKEGYRLTGVSLDSNASRKENLRLWADDITDERKYALLHIFTSNIIIDRHSHTLYYPLFYLSYIHTDGKPVYMPMVKDLAEHERNKAANGDNPVVNRNHADADRANGIALYRAVRLDSSKFPIKVDGPYILVPGSLSDQTQCNSLKLSIELNIGHQSFNDGTRAAIKNSAAVVALDKMMHNNNIRKHEGVVDGRMYKTGDHVHEPRAYYHPDLQDYIAKGEGGFYHGQLLPCQPKEASR